MTLESPGVPGVRKAARSALVCGGTGLVGGHLLRLLGEDAHYHRVTSLVRRKAATPSGVDLQVVDFEQLDGFAAPPIDDAFCCLGTTRRAAGSAAAFRRVDLDYVIAFAQLAMRSGARRFMLVSSVGASPRSRLLYSRTKGEVEAAIQSLGFTTVVILRPSFLLGERAQGRPVETAAAQAFQWMRPAFVGPLRRYAPVQAEAVAQTLVTAATTVPEGVTVIESEGIR